MEFELSFTPVNHDRSLYSSGQLGSFIDVYTEGRFPDLTEVDVVLFSVPEFRGTSIKGSVDNFQRIREEYFKLFSGYERLRVVDLGNLLIGENKSDTFYLLVLTHLLIVFLSTFLVYLVIMYDSGLMSSLMHIGDLHEELDT